MPASENGKEEKGAAKGNTCSCGCESCGCGCGHGWYGHGPHGSWGGFWILRILIALIVIGFVFFAGVAIGRLTSGFGRSMMRYQYTMPAMGNGYYGYGARGGGGGVAIPPGTAMPMSGSATSTK